MIYISQSVVSVWEAEIRRWYQPETGGMLLGFETVSEQLVVTQATRPGPLARRRWRCFHPDDAWDIATLADIYEASGRVIRYLGEWHSHSFGNLQPSREDARTMRLIASHEPARMKMPISAIVARRLGTALCFALYQLSSDGQLEKIPAMVISS